MATVSVIVPVHNARPFLPESLGSLCGQTLSDIEVLCVDDCSDDGSREALDEAAARDRRIRVLATDANVGPGVARNLAIDEARGEFLAFLDADDRAEAAMLERAVARARETDADVVCFDAWILEDATGSERPARCLFPERFGGEPFNWRDCPDHVFQSFQNWPWNKLFRTGLVRSRGIRFQEIFRTEDLMFTCRALMEAARIACVEGAPLVHYRVGRAGSSINEKDAYALDFFTAFAALKSYLESAGSYEAVRRSFDNWAASATLYNLDTLRSPASFREAFDFMAREGLAALGLDEGRAEGYLYDPLWDERLSALARGDAAAYFLPALRAHERTIERLLQANEWLEGRSRQLDQALSDLKTAQWEVVCQRGRGDDLEKTVAELGGIIDALAAEKAAIVGSAEYRTGVALGRIPRAIQRRVLAHKAGRTPGAATGNTDDGAAAADAADGRDPAPPESGQPAGK